MTISEKYGLRKEGKIKDGCKLWLFLALVFLALATGWYQKVVVSPQKTTVYTYSFWGMREKSAVELNNDAIDSIGIRTHHPRRGVGITYFLYIKTKPHDVELKAFSSMSHRTYNPHSNEKIERMRTDLLSGIKNGSYKKMHFFVPQVCIAAIFCSGLALLFQFGGMRLDYSKVYKQWP